jgi:hypothetical protein
VIDTALFVVLSLSADPGPRAIQELTGISEGAARVAGGIVVAVVFWTVSICLYLWAVGKVRGR